MIINAPGVVVSTSNKRDLADGVVLECSDRGTVWVFDIQRIADYHRGQSKWWWNPLADVKDPAAADALAQIFADATTPADAQKDAYFDAAGCSLLGGLLLAAAVDGRQIDQVVHWLANPRDGREPVGLLEVAFPLSSAALAGQYAAAVDERSGLFSTASKAVRWLTSPAILAWVTDAGDRPQFDVNRFVRSGHDTLISLSREGVGSSAPLTTALTVAVLAAAEKYAQRQPHGRLSVPLVAVLDEVANVVRDRDLPSRFSYYPGAGIFLAALFQSYSQGVIAWKTHGMDALWSAATIRVVGAGLADTKHLESVARLVDEHRVERTSLGSSTGGRSSRSTTVSMERELILSAGDIHALPPGYVVVLQSGASPVLARMVPWWDRDIADRVRASLTKYGPKKRVTR
jgi:type IV secretory pathway TraG/TraD family ATPase VirD4